MHLNVILAEEFLAQQLLCTYVDFYIYLPI